MAKNKSGRMRPSKADQGGGNADGGSSSRSASASRMAAPTGAEPAPMPPAVASERLWAAQLIDPLFAAAIGIGVVEGLMKTEWFQKSTQPSKSDLFDLGVFCLGMLNLVWSWFGYHASVTRRPLKTSWRMLIDVALVTLYSLVLVKFREFAVVLGLLVAIFVLYAAWDLLKIHEYPEYFHAGEPFFRRYRREWITFSFSIVFCSLFGAHFLGLLPRSVVLILAFGASFAYRATKNLPLGEFLGMPRNE